MRGRADLSLLAVEMPSRGLHGYPVGVWRAPTRDDRSRAPTAVGKRKIRLRPELDLTETARDRACLSLDFMLAEFFFI